MHGLVMLIGMLMPTQLIIFFAPLLRLLGINIVT